MKAGIPIWMVAMNLLLVILLSSITSATNYQTNTAILQFPAGSGSWNARVPCSSPWIVRITDITDNKTGSASQSSSIFSPGITSPVGIAKRWLTPGSTPPGWVSPGPPCTITNSHGTVVVFVEIDGVQRESIANEDCSSTYDTVNGGTSMGSSYCDSTFDIYDPAIVPNDSASCTSSTDPTCYGKIHSEIDHDWKAEHYCGSSTTCDDVALGSQTTTSTLIDVQGFVNWDPDHLTVQWHNFNGWEIHPLTAWRQHQVSSSLTTSFTFSPSSPTTGQTITFTASASGGASPYTFTWGFGDGRSATGSPTTHVYSTSGAYTVTLTTSDSTGKTALVSKNVMVSTSDFELAANPYLLTVPLGKNAQSKIAATSLAKWQGTISYTTSVSSKGLAVSMQNPSVRLSAGQTVNDNLIVAASNTSPTGVYVVTVNGTTSSVLSIQVGSNQAAGVYNVTIKATAGALTHLLVVRVLIGQHTSSTSVICSPSSVIVNQASTCTATVGDTSSSSNITPTGTVTFAETGPVGSFSATICTLSSSSCSVAFTPTASGNALVTGTYGGDSSHSGSTSGTASITVNLRATSTTVICSSPVIVNQASSCTATVSDTSPGTPVTPTGGVKFTETGPAGSFSSAACTLVSGSCSVSFTATATGTAVITGVYDGDTAHNTSTSAGASVTVNPRTSSIALVCTSPVVVNQASNCTATITDSASGGSVTPTGSVSFISDSPGSFSATRCAVAAVSTGVAGCSVSYTPGVTGDHLITGSYGGDSVHSASSGASTVAVGQRATRTTVSCAPTGFDQACTATVTDNSPGIVVTPVGDVSFTTNSTGTFSSNSCTLSGSGASGVASCQVTYTPMVVATHTITGTYSGDTIHRASEGSTSIGFGKDSTTTTIMCSPSSVVINQATMCTVTVTDTASVGPTTPTGSAGFTSSGTGSFAGSPCTLIKQTATSSSCQVTYAPTSGAGTHSITTTYNGDATHNASTSSQAFALTVTLRTTSTKVSCNPTSVVANQTTTCTATVADSSSSEGITPNGSVGFVSNSTGVFVQPSCTLVATGTVGIVSCSVNYTPGATGSHAITASYPGDSSHHSSSSSVIVTVTGASPQLAYALVASTDGKVSRLYQNGTLTLIGQPVTTPLRSVAWKPDGSYALISGDFAVLLKYDGTTLTTIPTGLSTGFNFWTVSWKPDGSYALVGGTSGILFKYDGVKVTTIPNTSTTILAISWQPSGSYALLVGKSGLALTYDGTTVRSLATGTTFDLDATAWNPNGVYALMGGVNRTLLQFNGTTVAAINTSIVPPNNAIRAISFNQAGTIALLAGDNGMVLTYNGSTLTMFATLTSSWLYSIAWSSSGTAYIVGGGGTILAYGNGTLTKLPNIGTSQFRGIAWKPL